MFFIVFQNTVKMNYWSPYLLVVAISVCPLAEGREGRVIFMNTDNSIDIGK
jgi:hypothetical protein